MSLKEKLLNPEPVLIAVTLLGQPCEIRRLKYVELTEINDAQQAAIQENDPEKINETIATLILKSIIDDGEPMINSISPSDLVAIYPQYDMKSAADTIMAINYGQTDGIDKAKKS